MFAPGPDVSVVVQILRDFLLVLGYKDFIIVVSVGGITTITIVINYLPDTIKCLLVKKFPIIQFVIRKKDNSAS